MWRNSYILLWRRNKLARIELIMTGTRSDALPRRISHRTGISSLTPRITIQGSSIRGGCSVSLEAAGISPLIDVASRTPAVWGKRRRSAQLQFRCWNDESCSALIRFELADDSLRSVVESHEERGLAGSLDNSRRHDNVKGGTATPCPACPNAIIEQAADRVFDGTDTSETMIDLQIGETGPRRYSAPISHS